MSGRAATASPEHTGRLMQYSSSKNGRINSQRHKAAAIGSKQTGMERRYGRIMAAMARQLGLFYAHQKQLKK